MIERLESRRMMSVTTDGSVISISGTRGDDAINVSIAGGQLVIDDNGTSHVFALGTQQLQITAGAGADRVNIGQGVTLSTDVHGGRGADVVRGGGGADHVRGGGGNDRLLGRKGNDQLKGGSGDDKLAGGAGHDLLYLGRGLDKLGKADLVDEVQDFVGPVPQASFEVITNEDGTTSVWVTVTHSSMGWEVSFEEPTSSENRFTAVVVTEGELDHVRAAALESFTHEYNLGQLGQGNHVFTLLAQYADEIAEIGGTILVEAGVDAGDRMSSKAPSVGELTCSPEAPWAYPPELLEDLWVCPPELPEDPGVYPPELPNEPWAYPAD